MLTSIGLDNGPSEENVMVTYQKQTLFWSTIFAMGGFPVALMIIGGVLLGVQGLLTIISKFTSGLADTVSKMIAKAFRTAFKQLTKGLTGFVIGGTIGSILAAAIAFLPTWVIPTVSAFAFIASVGIGVAKILEKWPGDAWRAFIEHFTDIMGVVLSLAGLVLVSYVERFLVDDQVLMYAIGMLLAIAGFAMAIFIEDKGDSVFTTPYLEEMITGGVLALALVQWAAIASIDH